MLESRRRQHTSARGALDQALLQQIGFHHFFQGVAAFRQGSGQGIDAHRPAAIIVGDAFEIAAVHGIKAHLVHFQPGQRPVGDLGIHRALTGDGGEVAHPAQQATGHARRTAGAARHFGGAIRGDVEAQYTGATGDDQFQFLRGVVVHPARNAEAFAQGRGQQARTRGRPHQGEGRQIDTNGPRRRSLADDEVELKVLHGRIEHFLYGRIKAVDFVDEQNVPGLQIGQERRQIAGPGDHRPRGGAKAHAQFPRHDLGQGRLAQTGRTEKQGMVQGLAARLGGGNENLQVFAHRLLADEIVQHLRTQMGFHVARIELGSDHAVVHRTRSLPRRFNAWRIRVDESAPSPNSLATMPTASKASSRL